ncbi:DUF969 domain-containing protein [Fusobacterium sp. IOR10]|uniref:DUF969 domain-containing protein n=1 Tax=Fusobacterium sp. IOR10 TaxID=2665157 RepID=UPI0013D1C5FA|nr:DUF969 domain-containing protein [Fusobacterium sp. IOR10]
MVTLKLIGVIIIIIGFLLKLDTIAVVIVAGIATGLVSGIDFIDILSTLGDAFVKTRYMTVFLLTLAVIGILERNGLKEQASKCIGKLHSVTCGKVLSSYMIIRTFLAVLSLRLGGHIQFIRPLVYPMAIGAGEKKHGELSQNEKEEIKGVACAIENYGNFFGQNVFVASAGVLLIVGTLQELGIKVAPYAVSKAAIPISILAVIFSAIQNHFLEKKLAKREKKVEIGG